MDVAHNLVGCTSVIILKRSLLWLKRFVFGDFWNNLRYTLGSLYRVEPIEVFVWISSVIAEFELSGGFYIVLSAGTGRVV